MICKVKQTIQKYQMKLDNNTVVVALSGGADSVALLNVLHELKDEMNMQLIACHVNHSIRGAQAYADEKFAKELCKKLNVECKVLKADIPKLAEEWGVGLEECGRKVRYDFFESVVQDGLIATAHTLSDRCETLLLNETRGASVRGLRSIPAVRGNVVRPLIECTRADIEEYCGENGLEYVTDKTNFDDEYSRNRIRLNVIPQLKKINPSVEKAFGRLIESCEEDEAYFTELISDLLKKAYVDGQYDADFIISKPAALRKRIISEMIKCETGVTPESIHITMVEDILNGGQTEIVGNTVVSVKCGRIYINPVKEITEEWQSQFDLNKLSCEIPGSTVCGQIFNKKELPPTQIVHNKVVDFESIIGNLIVRNRRAGDSMKIAGSSCTKTLKKLFNEKKIENRNNLCILADEKGIVWVEGLGCSDRCKITDDTKKVLTIRRDKSND